MRSIVIIKNIANTLFTKHLFMTNVVTCGGLLGLGDCVVQQMDRIFKKNEKHDFSRTGCMIIMGVALGPFNHFWYTFLDHKLTGQSKTTVIKKIALDQVIAGPLNCTLFLLGISILEGQGVDGAKREWKDKFLKIYTMDWAFWPMAQCINFRFVPHKFRMLYVSSAALIWNCFLSYVKHKHNIGPMQAKSS